MLLSIYLLLIGLSILLILYGRAYDHSEMVLLAFTTTFLLGLVMANATIVLGWDTGIQYKSGVNYTQSINSTYKYGNNYTGVYWHNKSNEPSCVGVNEIECIKLFHYYESTSNTENYVYSSYSNVWFGSMLAIISFFGFFGMLLGRGKWFK